MIRTLNIVSAGYVSQKDSYGSFITLEITPKSYQNTQITKNKTPKINHDKTDKLLYQNTNRNVKRYHLTRKGITVRRREREPETTKYQIQRSYTLTAMIINSGHENWETLNNGITYNNV